MAVVARKTITAAALNQAVEDLNTYFTQRGTDYLDLLGTDPLAVADALEEGLAPRRRR